MRKIIRKPVNVVVHRGRSEKPRPGDRGNKNSTNHLLTLESPNTDVAGERSHEIEKKSGL